MNLTSFSHLKNPSYCNDKAFMFTSVLSTKGEDLWDCISRPLRFGKSFEAQMLCAYYDKTCDSSALFDDLTIAGDSHYTRHLNQYDVIYLDMTGIIGEAPATDIIPYIKRNIIHELTISYPELEAEEGFTSTLINAAALTGNRFIMIIDEWDAPIREFKTIVR